MVISLLQWGAAASGAAVGLGLFLIISAWREAPAPEPGPDAGTPILDRARAWLHTPHRASRAWDEVRGAGWSEWRWALALQAMVVIWLLSGWPAAAVGAGAAVVGVPALLGTGRAAKASIERAEAVEGWSRRLADVLLTGAGLEQAVAVTTHVCPDAVRAPVTALAARLNAGWSTVTALRVFGDDLDDATADLVVATLILGARRRGPGLAHTLTAVADSLSDQVTARRKVEAERAKPRATAHAVTLIILTVLTAGSASGDYTHPYATSSGQLVLAGLLGALAAALYGLHRLAATPPATRLLTAVPTAVIDTERSVLR